MEIAESLEYLLELDQQQQRLNTLIRQGMLPARQLPILHRALANMRAGKLLPPYEREALSKLLDKMMGFQLGDDITYNRARLHTQKTKYQTEEKNMAKDKDGDVVVYDGSEDCLLYTSDAADDITGAVNLSIRLRILPAIVQKNFLVRSMPTYNPTRAHRPMEQSISPVWSPETQSWLWILPMEGI